MSKINKWQSFLQQVDVDAFTEDYYTMTNNDLCTKYDIDSNVQKKVCRYLGIKKSREQIYNIKKRVCYDVKDWSSAVQKRKQTSIEKFGVDNVNKLQITKQKIKDTKMHRYGHSGFNNMQKIRQTNLCKYGVEYTFQSEHIKQKIKQTMIDRYGGDNPQRCESIRENTKQTNIRKYGVPYATMTENNRNTRNSPSAIKKCIETKRIRGNFNKSSQEDTVYQQLCDLLDEKTDIIRQYKDDRYPFACDFYIKSKDLFIECNFHWTHGGRPYDPNNIECQEQLKIWEEKANAGSQFYKNAIQTWTIRDTNKNRYQQCLNIKVFYNLDDFYLWCNTIKLTPEQQNEVIARTIHENL